MTVTPEQAIEGLRRRERARREAGRERARRLRSRLPEAVAGLRRRGATRAWLFGSLAEDRAHAESDVDLAVLDLPREDFFAALAEVMTVLGCAVDLVRLETAGATLRDRILELGEELELGVELP